MHTVFQKTLIAILRGRYIYSHVTPEEAEASGTWEAVRGGAKGDKSETWLPIPAAMWPAM